MSNQTPAQEEFAAFLDKNSRNSIDRIHPEDRDEAKDGFNSSDDEEERYRASQIDAAMRMPAIDSRGGGGGGIIKLPPASFDGNHATGVKGVIADARNYEAARQSKWKNRVRAARRSVFGGGLISSDHQPSDSEGSVDGDSNRDEESFLQQWRESRRRELEAEGSSPAVRTRRTSPSVRLFGRMDEVDALGYLNAIEKVGRETVVVVFVYDHECEVSAAIESALRPLVGSYPYVHFVKIHYEDIEFDNAAVPTVLAYRNQGDLFANLTGIIELIPEDEDFDSDALKRLFQKHSVL